MKHFPSIEALTAADDRRLLAELEICDMLEKLARVRALVDRANHLIMTVLASPTVSIRADEGDGPNASDEAPRSAPRSHPRPDFLR